MPGKLERGGAGAEERASGDAEAEDTNDGLPPGWFKEIKYRKTGRKDTQYVDPVSGYVFFTQKDVSRYLETGNIRNCRSRPRKRMKTDIPAIEEDNLHAAKSKSKSQGAATEQRNFSEDKPPKKVKMKGTSNGPRPDTNLMQNSEASTANKAQPKPSLQNAKQQLAVHKNPPEKPDDQPREASTMETKGIASISSRDTPGKPASTEQPRPRKRGRPPGSLNKTKPPKEASQPARSRRRVSTKTKAKQEATTSLTVDTAADANAGAPHQPADDHLQATEKASALATAQLPSLSSEGKASEFDLSSAESALFSVYRGSKPDPCIEFAVKILMDEMFLPQVSCRRPSKLKPVRKPRNP